jgi:hypothetical protein
MTVRQVVIDDRRKALAEEVKAGMRPDIACAARHKDVRHLPEAPRGCAKELREVEGVLRKVIVRRQDNPVQSR